MDIAIIGSGISGLSAAWALRHDHRLRIFERDTRPGGHVKTVTVPTAEGPVNVDTGFIVYNEPTYPHLTALFAELGIETQPTEMSLGHTCEACDLEFGSRHPLSMFAQPGALARPSHWGMIRDIRRFYAIARQRLDEDIWTRQTLAQFLDEGGYGNSFRNHFLVPVVSAVWSTSAAEIMDFPADYLLRFLDNHGLIGFGNGKPWRTVVGGSMTYVERILDGLPAETLVAGDPVVDVRRDEEGVTVNNLSGRSERFDAVVMATHADVTLSLLNDADSAERKALGLFEYTTNDVVLHTDESLLPRHRRARGSWNVETADCREPAKTLVMSYWMNNLQRLKTPAQYVTSVNPGDRIPDEKVIVSRPMSHPKYTFSTLDGQAAVGDIQGHRGTYYAGAHLGYGFHEDGCRAGIKAAEMIEEHAARPLELAA
ncbi:MAG: FAD-dependent oxidoreductase [Candidatus Limnocylindrales bacterium]